MCKLRAWRKSKSLREKERLHKPHWNGLSLSCVDKTCRVKCSSLLNAALHLLHSKSRVLPSSVFVIYCLFCENLDEELQDDKEAEVRVGEVVVGDVGDLGEVGSADDVEASVEWLLLLLFGVVLFGSIGKCEATVDLVEPRVLIMCV